MPVTPELILSDMAEWQRVMNSPEERKKNNWERKVAHLKSRFRNRMFEDWYQVLELLTNPHKYGLEVGHASVIMGQFVIEDIANPSPLPVYLREENEHAWQLVGCLRAQYDQLQISVQGWLDYLQANCGW